MFRNAYWIPQMVAILALALAAGCASSSSKSKPVNVQALSEHTVAMVGELQFDLRRVRSVYLSDFVNDESSPAVDEYEAAWQEFEVVMKATVAYSMTLVNLSVSPPADGARQILANDLGALIDVIYAQSLIQQSASDFAYDDVLQLVRAQETFVDALFYTQPAVDELARTMTRMIVRVQELAELAREEVESEIRMEHRGTLAFRRSVSQRLESILAGLEFIEKSRSGDADAWTALLAADGEMSQRLGAQVKPTMKNLDNAEDILLNRLRVIDLVRERTESNYQTFLQQRRDLIEIEQTVTNTLRRAQISVIVWSRVHGQIATGEGSGGFSFGSLSAILVGYAL
jgi:hypothetical protein